MPKVYTISVWQEIQQEWLYSVVANSEEEAVRKYKDGDYEDMKRGESEAIEGDDWDSITVREEEEIKF